MLAYSLSVKELYEALKIEKLEAIRNFEESSMSEEDLDKTLHNLDLWFNLCLDDRLGGLGE